MPFIFSMIVTGINKVARWLFAVQWCIAGIYNSCVLIPKSAELLIKEANFFFCFPWCVLMRLILTPWHREWAWKGVTCLVSLNKKRKHLFCCCWEEHTWTSWAWWPTLWGNHSQMSHTCAAAEEHFCLGDIPTNMRKKPETSPLGLDSELLAWRWPGWLTALRGYFLFSRTSCRAQSWRVR